MTTEASIPPVLSTPDTHILNEIEPVATRKLPTNLSDEDFDIRYEIARTVEEIKANKWHCVALQFPDEMLPDSARVYQLLARGLKPESLERSQNDSTPVDRQQPSNRLDSVKLTILADTSYGSCCVDEIAAEHIDADGLVHYGRACLSPTARLPVVHVFTKQDLDHEQVVESFKEAFSDLASRVIVTADMPYAHHVEDLFTELRGADYINLHAASITHDPSSLIPNRTIPEEAKEDPDKIRDWSVFHVSEPPTSLLLTLSSRVAKICIYPTNEKPLAGPPKATEATTSQILRRRYALVTSLATVSIWGILINTLSVKNYLHIVDHVKSRIADAGKKSYLFVVGKLNAAKVANFSEIGGWVVVGCWETSLVDSKDFYRPVITPFELDLALKKDKDRLWTGEWRADFAGILENETAADHSPASSSSVDDPFSNRDRIGDWDSEEESVPPEFDLRAGRYVSQTRPMQPRSIKAKDDTRRGGIITTTALARRANGDIVAVNGVASPAAEFLKSKRTWQGLGSDFQRKNSEEEEGSAVEEGRSGVARGYTVGESARH